MAKDTLGEQPKPARKFLLAWKTFPLISFIIFGLLYLMFFKELDLRLLENVSNSTILNLFPKYGPFAGFVFGLLSMLLAYLLLLLVRILKLKQQKFSYLVVAVLAVLPWYFFARQLVFFENQYTEFARALIFFVGQPLLQTTVTVFYLLAIITTIHIIKVLVYRYGLKREIPLAHLVIFLLCPFVLSGCLGNLEAAICDFLGDSDHCFQSAAIQEGESEECEKIKGKDFASGGSNPPRDKCYLLIAENTGDLSACNNIKGGMLSYTREECILGAAMKHGDASGCKMLSGSDYERCANTVGPKILASGILEIDQQIKVLQDELAKSPDAGLQDQLNGLKGKRQDMLDLASNKVKDEYTEISDPVYQEIAGDYATGELDKASKDKLVELNRRLKGQGETLNKDQYEALKNYFKFKSDPDNDIENMTPEEILPRRWNERIGNAVDYLKFWNSNPTATEQKYDEQLLFYSRMLERQEAIAKGQSKAEQDLQRNLGIIGGGASDFAQDKIKSAIIKTVFTEVTDTTVGITTKVLGEALDTVKKEAKSAEFRGLVRAYNLGMQEEIGKYGGDVEKAHKAVTANLQKDPYQYEDKNTFAKYGNILENKDCDGSNPHCINRDVFWKAMKKSYEFQQKK